MNTNVERNTKSLVAGVRARFESHPRVVQPILDSMDGISQEFLALLESGAGDKIGEMEELIDYNQGLLATLGVSHPALDNVIAICAAHGESGSRVRDQKYNQTGVDRDKPGIQVWNYGVGMIQGYQLDYHSDSFNVSFIMLFLNMVDLGHLSDA